MSAPAQLTFVVGGAGFSGVETAGEIEDFVAPRAAPLLPEDPTRRDPVPHRRAQGPRPPRAGSPRWATTRHRKLRQRGFRLHLGTAAPRGPRGRRRHRRRRVHPGPNGRLDRRRSALAGRRRVGHRGRPRRPGGRSGPTMETSRAGVWAIGDCARIPDPDREGDFHAPTAQNAVREAKRLARNVVATIDGRRGERRAVPVRRHRDPGQHRPPHRASGRCSACRSAAGSRGSCGAATTGAACPGIGGKARVGARLVPPRALRLRPGAAEGRVPAAAGGNGPIRRRRPPRRTVDPRG